MKTANKPSTAAWLADRLCIEIQQRNLREGDVLTTENELTQRYGVSRSIAREAISRLQGLGIITSRQRKGVIVERANPVALLRSSIPFTGRSRSELQRVAQMRYALEVGAVDLALCHASDEQLLHLQNMEEEYARSVREQEPSIAVTFVDAAFHGLILEMTGNPLITGMHCVLEEHFRIWTEERERRLAVLGEEEREYYGERSIWEHHLITEAVCRRDAEQARAFLREHLAACCVEVAAELADKDN
jgi:DNA-binding FadR family transcriptional regulator